MRTPYWPGLVGLSVAAILYGASFMAVRDAVEGEPPMGFNGWRFVVAASLMLLFFRKRSPRLITHGVIAGCLFSCGYLPQTIGLVHTTESKSAFITALYIILTPLAVYLLYRGRPPRGVAIGLPLAVGGLALLLLTGSNASENTRLDLNVGDAWTFLCAIGFAAHMAFIGHTARRHHVLTYVGVQMMVVGILSLSLAIPLEPRLFPESSNVEGYWLAVLFTAIFVSCGATTLQVWAQTRVDPTRAALILAGEPVVAAITAMIFRPHEQGQMEALQWIGAGLILFAVVWVELRAHFAAGAGAASVPPDIEEPAAGAQSPLASTEPPEPDP